VDAELDPGPAVDQEVKPLAGGQLLAGVLGLDLLRPAALLDPLAALAQVIGERAQQAVRGICGHCGK
jgi:hypothetical protein